jgi:hypothetical protein
MAARSVALAIAMASFFLAPSSRADALEVSAAALVGYGLNSSLICENGSSNGDGTCNPFGFGVGVRAGVTLPIPVYLGGTFVYHTGFSRDFSNGFSSSGNVAYPGVEAGYDFRLGPITLRPYLGVGYALVSDDGTSPGNALVPPMSNDKTDNRLAVWPGAVGLVSFGRVFVGVDLRYFFTNDAGSSAPCIFGTVGVKIL